MQLSRADKSRITAIAGIGSCGDGGRYGLLAFERPSGAMLSSATPCGDAPNND